MRATFRLKLLATLSIAALGIGVIMLTGVVITNRADAQLTAIERRFVPLVELRPALEASLEKVGRAFQDAVAAQDAEMLSEAAAIRAQFLAQLATAGASLERRTTDDLREAFDDYYLSAHDVSLRLISGDTGIGAVEAMTGMQQKHAAVRAMLNHVAAFNQETLAEAFGLVQDTLRSADNLRLAIGLSCLAAVVLLSSLMSREMIRSLSTLRQGLLRFGQGDFAGTIEVRRNDEFGEVAASANRMARQIQELLAERDRNTAMLTEANAMLAVSNRELEAFSYSVSHDLRAPLRAIDGFSKVLLAEYSARLDDRGKHYLERVRAGSQRMSILIDDMLNLSRISRSPMRLEAVDVTATASAIVDELRAREPDRRVAITIEPDLHATGDPRLAAILFENLLGNAWKFTRKTAEARIHVGRERRGDASVFYVADNGAGFDMAQAEKLFHPFQRLHADADFEGTGVGLATVQRIVHRHGGTIWAESRPGAGATFYFTFGKANVETANRTVG